MDLVLEKLDKLDSKVDRLDGRLDSVDKTLAVNTEQLAGHMRRTELLEADLKPIKKHVGHVEGGMKLLGVVAVIVGILKAAGLL